MMQFGIGWLDTLSALGNAASIGTGIVAVWAFFVFIWSRRGNTRKLEAVLKQWLDQHPEQEGEMRGRKIGDLSPILKMSEAEIFEAARHSDKIHFVRVIGKEYYVLMYGPPPAKK